MVNKVETSQPDDFQHEYLLVQRCRTLHSWPAETSSTEWHLHRIPSPDASFELFIRYQIGTETRGLVISTPKADHALMLENKIFCPRGSEQNIAFEKNYLEPKMIDFAINVKSSAELDPQSLAPLSYNLRRFVAFCSIYLDSVVIPIMGTRFFRRKHTGYEERVPLMGTVVKDRRDTNHMEIADLMRVFDMRRNMHDEETWRRFDVASRRYLAAMAEQDVIDRFCDFWEACEFLTKDIKVKKASDPKGRIAHALAQHMGVSKAAIERQYIGPFWKIRKDLVHEAVEDEPKVGEAAFLLEHFVAELLRYKVGLGFRGREELAKVIEVCRA
jgi:hypothetical protein